MAYVNVLREGQALSEWGAGHVVETPVQHTPRQAEHYPAVLRLTRAAFALDEPGAHASHEPVVEVTPVPTPEAPAEG